MRCLRQLTKEQLKATIFLSKENYDTLDDELRKNYNMEISDFGKSPNTNKKVYKVRVLPPPRSIKMKRLWHEYSLIEKEYSVPIDFHLAELDESKYEAKMYEKRSLRLGLSEKETNIDSMKEQERFSEFSLTAEISRYMNISCLTIAKILRESVDGSDNIVAAVNRHNEIFLNIPRKLRITYVQFFVLGIYFEKLSGYTDNIKRQNCQNEVSRWIQHRE